MDLLAASAWRDVDSMDIFRVVCRWLMLDRWVIEEKDMTGASSVIMSSETTNVVEGVVVMMAFPKAVLVYV